MTASNLRAALCRGCRHRAARSSLPPLQAHQRPFTISARNSCPEPSTRPPSERTSCAHKSGLQSVPFSSSASSRSERKSGLSALKGSRHKDKEKSKSDKRRMILGQSPDIPIRTRFAPSPTGYLHLGSLRTALFNNLASLASQGGSFILRIEDTDQNRLVEGAEDRIVEDLKWLGLSWDEGPDCGGPHGPYRQSARLDIYKDHIKQLIDSGHAYRCFCDQEQLETQRRLQHEAGEPTVYSKTCRSIDPTDAARRADSGESHVVRFKGDTFGSIPIRDVVYGRFQKKDAEDDFILLKRDGYPTYHFANVVDDHLMEITHVIRGEEWLISTPKHVALYEAFGWTPPKFAHLGLLTNNDGSKLSKRQSSANVSSYRENHVSPMALQVWLASLGASFATPVHTIKGVPRSIQGVADTLSFNFTKGSIKLNMEKLDNIESVYRKAIMSNPPSDPSPLQSQESQLIRNVVLLPTLSELTYLTSGGSRNDSSSPSFVDAAWNLPKDLIPALSSAPEQGEEAISKVRDVYWWLTESSSATSLEAMKALLLTHPYLFWRVPTDLYRRTLALISDNEAGSGKKIFSQDVLDALETLCDDASLWPAHVSQPSGINAALVQKMTGTLNPQENKKALYTTHRLIMAGQHDISSPSVDFLSRLLGADETRHRVKTVQDLVKQLRDGGDELRKEWLSDAWEKYPDFMQAAAAAK